MTPASKSIRKRLTLKDELILALLPTSIVLIVFILVEALSNQRLLFASLASSAFLIYLDPQHATNRVKTLVLSQLMAASVGLVFFQLVGPTYGAAAVAMVVTIVAMIVLDVMHPPAVATGLSFAFKAGNESNVVLFGLAVLITAILVLIAKVTLWLMVKVMNQNRKHKNKII